MEPRSWKWIQTAVIALAAAVGLGAALWYQNRPIDDALPAAAVVPGRKTVLHPFHPEIIPNVAPMKPGAATAHTTGLGAAGRGAAPSQSSPYSSQNTVVDPMAHLRLPPPSGTAPAFPTSTVTPPVSPEGSTLLGSPSVPAPPPSLSSPSVSPLVTTAPPADGGAAAPSTPPGL